MSVNNGSHWVMPEWMRQYERFFQDRGLFSVESIMNCYGAKCAGRLVEAGSNSQSPSDIQALIMNAQVGLLVSLRSAGLLKDPASFEEGK